jgi:hypothetical protein
MTAIEGVDELVNAAEVFDLPRIDLAPVFARGVRNFGERLTLTIFGAVMFAGVNVAAPAPIRANPSYQEPPTISDADAQWDVSVDGLSQIIASMESGIRPALADELSRPVREALASVARRDREDLPAWAKALASEDADIDD